MRLSGTPLIGRRSGPPSENYSDVSTRVAGGANQAPHVAMWDQVWD